MCPWLKGRTLSRTGYSGPRRGPGRAWEQKTGIHIASGDVLLVRTGLYKRHQEVGSWNFTERAAGLHAAVVSLAQGARRGDGWF